MIIEYLMHRMGWDNKCGEYTKSMRSFISVAIGNVLRSISGAAPSPILLTKAAYLMSSAL